VNSTGRGGGGSGSTSFLDGESFRYGRRDAGGLALVGSGYVSCPSPKCAQLVLEWSWHLGYACEGEGRWLFTRSW